MAAKSAKYLCWVVIAVSFFAANYAAQHHWPLWSITIAGAVSLAAVVTYILTMQSQQQ
jgi:hypothetical protein